MVKTFKASLLNILMRVGVLFSGGKDSSLAFLKAMRKEEVVCLISLISENPESFMFHTPNVDLTEMQAEAIGLPIIIKRTKGRKEEELEDLKDAVLDAVRKYAIEGVVTGAVASVYQASRVQRICNDLKLKCFNPLWLKDQVEILEDVVKEGLEVIISGVFAYPFDESWLGRKIDKDVIETLKEFKEKYEINPAGEGGEIETTVLDAPFFRKRIVVEESETHFKDNAGVFVIKRAELIDKGY